LKFVTFYIVKLTKNLFFVLNTLDYQASIS